MVMQESYWLKCSRCNSDCEITISGTGIVTQGGKSSEVLYFMSVQNPNTHQRQIVCKKCKEEYNKLKENSEKDFDNKVLEFLKAQLVQKRKRGE